MKYFFKYIIFPSIFYIIAFFLITYPAVNFMTSHIWGDSGDGLQNIWNLWWFKKVITSGQDLFFANYFFFPQGAHLWGHTLQPFNGLLALLLGSYFSMEVTYNVIVLASFALSGYFTFLLAHYLTRNYWGSVWAGYFFSFTGYRFAHLQGHMNLISTQFIPLFVLFLIQFIHHKTYKSALGLALSLFLCLLVDLFYGYICFMVLLFFIVYDYFIKKKCNLKEYLSIKYEKVKDFRTQYFVLFFTFFLTSGVFLGSYFIATIQDPLQTKGGSKSYSMDLLAPFIYGGASSYKNYTDWYWEKLGNNSEMSVYLGNLLIVVFIYSLFKRKLIDTELGLTGITSITLWLSIGISFFLLAMGVVF